MNTFDKPTRLTAIAVDVQNDFCPGGSLGVTHGEDVIAPLNQLFAAVRAADGTTIATRDWHPETTPHFADYGGTWPTHCVRKTPGAAFHSELAVDEETVVISKGVSQADGYSGFEGETDDGRTLETLLRPRTDRERVIVAIGGLATDYCVLNTVLDATKYADAVREARQGVIDVYALTDAMRAVNINPNDEAHALKQMQEAGARLITTEAFMEMMR